MPQVYTGVAHLSKSAAIDTLPHVTYNEVLLF